jgi:hypothetical protein
MPPGYCQAPVHRRGHQPFESDWYQKQSLQAFLVTTCLGFGFLLIGIPGRQRLDWRLPDSATPTAEVRARQLRRTLEQRGIEWTSLGIMFRN